MTDNKTTAAHTLFKKIIPVCKDTDMDPEMQKKVMDKASEMLERFDTDKGMAENLRRHFMTGDSVWQCFVGRKFGCSVTYESKNYIYFYIGQTAFLLFKTG